jgi:hypothetical protein
MNSQQHFVKQQPYGDFNMSAQFTTPPGAAATVNMAHETTNSPTPTTTASPQQGSYYHAEKKFPCTFASCDRLFTSPHNVAQHNREAHTGEKPYACSVCAEAGIAKAFTRPASLYRHIRGVHSLDVDYARGKGVRKIVGPRKDPVPAAPVKTEPTRRQSYAAPMPTQVNGPEQRMYGARPDQLVVEQGWIARPVETNGALDFPTQEAPFQPPISAANMIMGYTCGYAICGTFPTADEYLTHLHNVHQQPRSADCTCTSCQVVFFNKDMYQPIFADAAPQQQIDSTQPAKSGPPTGDPPKCDKPNNHDDLFAFGFDFDAASSDYVDPMLASEDFSEFIPDA